MPFWTRWMSGLVCNIQTSGVLYAVAIYLYCLLWIMHSYPLHILATLSYGYWTEVFLAVHLCIIRSKCITVWYYITTEHSHTIPVGRLAVHWIDGKSWSYTVVAYMFRLSHWKLRPSFRTPSYDMVCLPYCALDLWTVMLLCFYIDKQLSLLSVWWAPGKYYYFAFMICTFQLFYCSTHYYSCGLTYIDHLHSADSIKAILQLITRTSRGSLYINFT